MNKKSLLNFWLLLLCMIVGVGSAWAEDVTYTLKISESDFNTTSYAANNNEKTSQAVCTTDNTKTYEVKWTSYQVMKSNSKMQWQKSKGYIYNSTDLGTINSVTVNSSAGTFTTYYGTKEHPTSGTTVGNGFFTTAVGSATGTTSSIVVSFTISEGGGSVPSNYSVTYDANGATSGEVPTDNTDYSSGATVTVLGNTGNLVKTGCAFGGWNTQADGEGTNYSAGSTFSITANTTLYAKWNPYAITALSNNDSYGTVSGTTTITATPNSGYRVVAGDGGYTVTSGTATVVNNGDNTFTVTPSSDCTITINFEAIPTHTAHFSVNGTIDANNNFTGIEGATIDFPEDPEGIEGTVFMGWVTEAIVGTTDEAPVFVPSATMSTSDVTFYAVFADKESTGGEVTKSYGFETASDADWTIDGPVRTEDAGAYAGNYSGRISTNHTYITFNSKVKVKEFSFAFKRTSNNTNYNVYVETSTDNSNWTAAESYAMGDFTNGSYDPKTKTFDGKSELYVRFHCYNTTAVRYVDDVTIKYDGETITYSNYCTTVVVSAVKKPVITVAENPFLFSTNVEITCETDDATIYYTLDGTDPTDASTEYSDAFEITSACTIKAIAIKGSDESSIATLTVTKNLAEPTVTIDATGITNTNVFEGTEAGSLSATVTYNEEAVEGAVVTWSGNNDETATIDANTGAVTLVAAGSVTFTATYAGNGDYSEKTATYNMTVTNSDPNAPGTQNNPYTVAQAMTAIDAGTGVTDVYVKGIVSQVDSYDGTKYITYWISDDGTTTNQFEVYKGLGIDGASFSALTDVKVGDKVVVKGNITKYYSTYEFNKDNELVSIATLDFAFDADSYEVECGGDLTITASSSNSSGSITYSSSATDVAEINATTGVVTAKKEGETTITATIAAADGFPGKSINVTLTVTDSREAATISFANTEVFALDEDGTYTQTATVAQGDYNGTISYEIESSTSDGALIDDATGELLFDKKGTIVVKATAGETATYKSNTATYMLRIRTTPTIAVSDQSIAYGEIYTYDVASNVEGGAVTITSSNEKVVEVDEYNMGGIAVGTSTITVSTAANDEYIAGSETFVLTITAPVGKTTAAVLGKTTIFKNKDLGYDGDGMDWEASKSAASFESAAPARGVQFGAAIGNFTLTSSASNVTKVSMVLSTNGSNNKISVSVGGNSFTTTYGNIDETALLALTSGMSKETVEFTGAGSGAITISVADNNKSVYFKSITVTSEIAVKLNASGYATYCSQYPLDFSAAEGYTAWQITAIEGETITFGKITGTIKGGQGILLKGDAGATVTLASADASTTLDGNLLFGTTAPTYIAADTYYGLSGNKFVKVNAGTVPAGKALLPASEISASARELTFVFNDGTTGISSIEKVQLTNDKYYNLNGQRVENPKKGSLYIVNGKKVIMK